MAPLIWRLIMNLSRSVAEVREDTDAVYLHVTSTCIPKPRFKRARRDLYRATVFFPSVFENRQIILSFYKIQ
jgi:hypothetical protein